MNNSTPATRLVEHRPLRGLRIHPHRQLRGQRTLQVRAKRPSAAPDRWPRVPTASARSAAGLRQPHQVLRARRLQGIPRARLRVDLAQSIAGAIARRARTSSNGAFVTSNCTGLGVASTASTVDGSTTRTVSPVVAARCCDRTSGLACISQFVCTAAASERRPVGGRHARAQHERPRDAAVRRGQGSRRGAA
ncbi:hypothetical protein ACU686_36615 [Yinghuangia aomiensis]